MEKKEIIQKETKKEPYVSKEDFERLMAQGNRKDMERLFDYEVIKFKESKKNKGEQWKLEKRLNDKDTCQLYRGSFIKKK